MFRKWRFFQFPEMAAENKKSGRELWLWLFVHLSIPALLLLSIFFTGPVRVNTSLFDMLPKTGQSRAVMKADAVLGERNGRELVILCAAPDFENAKKGAAILYAEFEQSSYFENINFFFDSQIIADFYRYFYNYRFVIAGSGTLTLLENGGAQEIAYDALTSAFGAFNFFPLDNIENDPFLLTHRRMEDFFSSSFLSGGNMTAKEDVLAAEKDGVWYVLLRLTLAPDAVSVQAGSNVIGKIYSAASAIKESMPTLEFYFSGIPFHSYESSSGAQREISIISTVTLLIILILFLYIFRSPLPVLFSIMAVGISLGLAATAALLVFREIHIITFVFGTTLIGTCIDYSVHFFTHWKGNPALENGLMIRRHISKSIIMSFISTEICFFVFIFAPFPILKQFAVFSMAGLLSSFLTCLCIYPMLKPPENEKRQFKIFSEKIFLAVRNLSLPRRARGVLFVVLIIATSAVLFFNHSSVKIENDISSLYTMSTSLFESEKKTAQVLDYGSPGWYFIVSGESPEETLRHEEDLAVRLEEEREKGNMVSFLGTSLFVPSVKKQKRTYEAMKNLLPLSEAQFEYLGFPAQYAIAFEEEFAAAQRYCLPENAPSYAGISNLWIGEQSGSYYSCVMPIKPVDEAVFRSIAEEFDYVHFINKQKDIGRDLDTLTGTILAFFLAAYIVISVIVRFVYPLRDSLKICAVPVFLILSAVAVLTANRLPIGFFSAAAFVLVFGLGLDYIFYMTGNKKEKNNLTLLGVVLSFLTTLLSFGALAFSGFMPVHIFGLTVSAGLGAAFISAVILQARDN
jgi:predicted exporter